jgi:hypothetical protein
MSGADRPVWIANAGDGSGRVFFVEQPGVIRIIGNSAPFLDLRSLPFEIPPCLFVEPLGSVIDLGLIPQPPAPRVVAAVSVAFPPDYDSKSHFYVSYILSGTLVVSRYTALNDPDVADVGSERVITNMPAPGCNGGQLIFSSDGTLYVNAQGPIANGTLAGMTNDLNILSGKMIPLLNENGLPLPANNGQFFWPFAREFPPTDCAIVGGVFSQDPSCRLSGDYLYSDGSGAIRSLNPGQTNNESQLLAQPQLNVIVHLTHGIWATRPFQITALGQDEQGRTYLANYGTKVKEIIGDPIPYWREIEYMAYGAIYRIEDDPNQFSVRARLAIGGLPPVLEWHGFAGRTYQVEQSSNLVNWLDTSPSLLGAGQDLSFPVSGESQFYRVRSLP